MLPAALDSLGLVFLVVLCLLFVNPNLRCFFSAIADGVVNALKSATLLALSNNRTCFPFQRNCTQDLQHQLSPQKSAVATLQHDVRHSWANPKVT